VRVDSYRTSAVEVAVMSRTGHAVAGRRAHPGEDAPTDAGREERGDTGAARRFYTALILSAVTVVIIVLWQLTQCGDT
jgi:hypothetical protein